MPKLVEQHVERVDAADYISGIVEEFLRDGACGIRVVLRDGACGIRVVVSNVPREEYDAIDGQVVRRFPDGDLKVERVCDGVQVEWVAAPTEPHEPRTIPVEAA